MFPNGIGNGCVFRNGLHGGCVFRIGLSGGCIFPNGLEKDMCSLMDYTVVVCSVLD